MRAHAGIPAYLISASNSTPSNNRMHRSEDETNRPTINVGTSAIFESLINHGSFRSAPASAHTPTPQREEPPSAKQEIHR